MNSGNLIIKTPVTIMGGYSDDFSKRDILTHRTMVQPTAESNGSQQGRGTIQIRSVVAPNGYVIIDGLIMGAATQYPTTQRTRVSPRGSIALS